MPIYEYACDDCRVWFDRLIRSSSPEPTCPQCGASVRKRVSKTNFLGSGGEHGVGKIYPYFDRGLGMQINSAKQRDAVCKARNLIPVDGNLDIQDLAAKNDEKLQGEVNAWKQIQKDYELKPEFRGYRELRDKGAYTDHLPKPLQAKAKKSLTYVE